MRISDWSSDVCSSDLATAGAGRAVPRRTGCGQRRAAVGAGDGRVLGADAAVCGPARAAGGRRGTADGGHHCRRRGVASSEEHTSELQSLMRIPYAVFCLKKNNIDTEIKKQSQVNTIRHI